MADPEHNHIKKRIVQTVQKQKKLGIDIFYGLDQAQLF